MSVTKKKPGAPTAEDRIKNRKAKLEKDMENAILKGEELAVASYLDCVNTLINSANGTLKGVSTTSQVSSAKVVKEWVEKIQEKQGAPVASSEQVVEEEEEEVVEEEEEEVVEISLISTSM